MTRNAARVAGLLVVGLLVGVPVLGSGPVAMATWSSQGSGTATGAAATMPTGNTPRAGATGTSVTVAWSAATMSNGTAVAGYLVHRYNAVNGAPATVGPSCSGVITTTSCTETSVPAGSWVYTDTPVQMSWTGGESAPSSSVTVP